jgi:hypothetical protein
VQQKQFSIGIVAVTVKVLPFSIDFLTPSLNFLLKVNNFPKEDLKSLSNGLECSLAFYEMHKKM